MKTMTIEQVETKIRRTPELKTNFGKSGARSAALPFRPIPPALIENNEYEWTTALNLPGLIVSPQSIPSVRASDVRLVRRLLDEVFETEDGDATSFCQLPGTLGIVPEVQVPDMPTTCPQDELDVMDEYADIAAMQMPGQLIEPSAVNADSEQYATPRGLCATCVYCDTCDFPKPSGGVWRCEEYA